MTRWPMAQMARMSSTVSSVNSASRCVELECQYRTCRHGRRFLFWEPVLTTVTGDNDDKIAFTAAALLLGASVAASAAEKGMSGPGASEYSPGDRMHDQGTKGQALRNPRRAYTENARRSFRGFARR